MAWSGYSEQGQGGDERGPATFSFRPVALPMAQGVATTQLQMNNNRVTDLTLQTQGAPDRTLEVLANGAQKLLEPHLAKIKADLFLEGMKRAAEGESVQDIQENRPWYSQIFGDGATVEGARAYTVEASAAKFSAAVEQAMPELRKLNLDEATKSMQAISQQFRTGDKSTDAAIGLSVMKTMPVLMKAQVKENYKYVQEQNMLQQGNAWLAQGDLYQTSMRSADSKSPEDIDTMKVNTARLLKQSPNQDDASYQKNLGNFALLQAEAGNFHTVSLFKEAGFLDRLPLDQRRQVEAGIERLQKAAAVQAREDYAGLRYEVQSRILAGERVTGKQVLDMYSAANEQYASKTGNPMPVFPVGDRTQTAMSAERAIKLMDNAQAKEIAKQQEDLAKIKGVQDAIRGGVGISALKNSGAGIKPETVQYAAYQEYQQLAQAEPAQAIEYLAKASDGADGYIHGVADDLANKISRSNGFDENFKSAYKQFSAMGQSWNQSLQAKYFSGKDLARLRQFDTVLAGRDLDTFGPAAFDQVRPIRNDPGYRFSKDEDGAVNKFVDSRVRMNSWTTFGLPKFDNASMSVIKNALAAQYGTIRQGSPDQRAGFEDALAMARKEGLEYGGGFAWVNPKNSKPLSQAINDLAGDAGAYTDTDVYNALGVAVKDNLKKAYGEVDSAQVVRGMDINGKAFFTVYGRKDGVQQEPTFVSEDDILDKAKVTRARHQKNILTPEEEAQWGNLPGETPGMSNLRPQSPGVFHPNATGDEISNLFSLSNFKDPGVGVQPSISDTNPEHWAKYREWQANQRAGRK